MVYHKRKEQMDDNLLSNFIQINLKGFNTLNFTYYAMIMGLKISLFMKINFKRSC